MAKKVTKKTAKKTAKKTPTATRTKSVASAAGSNGSNGYNGANGSAESKPRRVASTKSSHPKAAATRKSTTTATPSPASAVSEARIRERAYEIYRTGRNPSDPTADWFQAEQELRAEIGA